MLLQPLDGVSAAIQQTAEQLVAAAIGAASLEARSVAQTGVLVSGVIPLRDGPLTAITSFSVNGYALTPTAFPWFLQVVPFGAYGYAGGMYALTYTAGWTEDSVPEAIKQAVTQTAQALAAQASTGGLKEYRVGEVTEVYNTAEQGVVPPAVSTLLAPFRPLRF